MQLNCQAIICAVRHHGENGAIVRVVTPDDGLCAGYVRGARSRMMRPILIPANSVQCQFRRRSEDQLASLTVELVQSRAPLLAEPLPAAALDWVMALTASTLPEGQHYPGVFDALSGIVSAVEMAPSARGWALALVAYEALLLSSLGYGGTQININPEADWAAIVVAFERGRAPLDQHFFSGRPRDLLATRDRLVARLKRAVA